jgi:hypothetical protein
MLALPTPVFGLLLGREWYAEPGAPPGAISRDILADMRRPGAPGATG